VWELITLKTKRHKKMKMLVKIAKSLHVDGQTLNAMFVGYFVLLVVAGTMIVKSVNGAGENEITASSEVRVESAQMTN
jgi:hypothetical protein